MVSPLGKSGIWATVGAVLVVLTATLGWILYPNIINSVSFKLFIQIIQHKFFQRETLPFVLCR